MTLTQMTRFLPLAALLLPGLVQAVGLCALVTLVELIFMA